MHAPNDHTCYDIPEMQPQAAPKVIPVQADMETVCDHGQGKVSSSAKFFRDESGRTRIEHGDIAAIHDPLKGESFVLNMPQKTAIPSPPQSVMPSMPSAPVPKPGMPNPPIPQLKPPAMQEAADLGQKMINGVKVLGKRYTMPQAPQPPGMPEPTAMPQMPKMAGAPALPKPPAMPQVPTSEVWTSPDLNLPIQSSMMDPKTGSKCVTEMKNIRQGVKLNPSMFKVPPDFKIAPPVKAPIPT